MGDGVPPTLLAHYPRRARTACWHPESLPAGHGLRHLAGGRRLFAEIDKADGVAGEQSFRHRPGSDFVWIDDQPLAVEVEALRGRNLLGRLIVIDTNKDDDGLLCATTATGSWLRFCALLAK
jgi:hypothetical protein